MADGGIGNQSPATIFQARLDTADGISSVLTLNRYQGNKVVVSGVTVSIPSTGLTRDVTDNLIDAAGADAGAPPAASTLYYVYVSNSRASFSPSSIRLSAQAPTLVNGVKYLGASGNPLDWRFVGWVLPNATPQFESTPANRTIVNYYNRLRLPLFLCPGYNDGAGDIFYSFHTQPFAELNNAGAFNSRIKFISNGEDSVWLKMQAHGNNFSGQNWTTAVGVDTTSEPHTVGYLGAQGTISGQVAAFFDEVLSEGDHFATPLGSTQTDPAITVGVQFNKAVYSMAHDIPATHISGNIFG